MTEDMSPEVHAELKALTDELVTLNASIGVLKDNADDVKARIRKLVAIAPNHSNHRESFDNGLSVDVALNRRLDARLVTERYPIHEYVRFYKAVPDVAVIRDTLSPAEYEALMVTVGEPKVTIR